MKSSENVEGVQNSLDQRNEDTAVDNKNSNIRVAFCNRYDPVPRATTDYVKWFLRRWDGHDEQLDPSRTSPLIPFGQIVTLDGAVRDQVTARWFTGDQFRRLAYLDPTQHSMELYLKNTFLLLKQSGYNPDAGILEVLK
jgi:hypothetical protein